MELEGRIADIGLPDIFRLLRVSGSTGTLRIISGRQEGQVMFSRGQVYYAFTNVNTGTALGARLVKMALLREGDLRMSLMEACEGGGSRPLASLLAERGLVQTDILEGLVKDQIEDCTFSFFNWPNGQFQFVPGGEPPASDSLLFLDAEGVVMEGCRRVDEWELMMGSLGSPEKVPLLSAPVTMESVKLDRQEWDIICFIDGHRDINTIISESGFDRFRTVKTVFDLLNSGLLITRDPTLDLLGQKLAIAVRGPIDVYNLTFLSVAITDEVTSHLRIETLDGEDVEVRISAGVREAEDEDGMLIYTAEARTPPAVLKRMALETSGFVVLVNINSRDSLHVSRADIALMEDIGDRPYVVAIYASLVDEKVTPEQVREILELRDRVPVVPFSLRNPEQTTEIIRTLRALIP